MRGNCPSGVRILSFLAAIVLVAGDRPAPAEDLSVGMPRRYDMAPNASGFFIDMEGTVLTARHAVQGCSTLYTLKDGRVARADLVATSPDDDLALVRSTIKPYLAATFATDAEIQGSQPVFAASYDDLQHMKDRAKVMYNGFVVDRVRRPDEIEFMLYSGADHGTSGSPVLNGKGLVIGLITKRETTGGLSGQSVVVAVSGVAIQAFLRRAGVAFDESDGAQISPLQARAPRANTLSVGIICGG